MNRGCGLIVIDRRNRKTADGEEFWREGSALHRIWNSDPYVGDLGRFVFDDEPAEYRRAKIIEGIMATKDLTRMAFFCHGTQTSISAGFATRRRWKDTQEVQALADAIAGACECGHIDIGLYACLTGRGAFWHVPGLYSPWRFLDNKKNYIDRNEKVVTYREGFAMFLCSELHKRGISSKILAHMTAGHTTKNPYKAIIQSVDVDIANYKCKDSTYCLTSTEPARRTTRTRVNCTLAEMTDPYHRFRMML